MEYSARAAKTKLSVNELVRPLVVDLISRADALGIAVDRLANGVTLVDGGVDVHGSVEAGLRIGEICMGGLGRVDLAKGAGEGWPTWLEIASSRPVLACLGSQYAGWSLAATKEEAGGKKFFALGSGPARALAGREKLFAELGYGDSAATGVLVLEVDRQPPPAVIDKVLRDCVLRPEGLTVILTPTASLAGTTQVVARALEVALHKAHGLSFRLADIVDGSARAPLPAPSPEAGVAMGRTNDAILYGGQVHLTVAGDGAAARDLARRLPAMNSRDYGRSFAEIFKAYDYDFYRIDPALFAPAEVWVSSLDSGTTWHAGRTDLAFLRSLWQEGA